MSLNDKITLTTEEIKSHLRIEHDLENTDLERLKQIACNRVDQYMGYDFTTVNKEGETLLIPYVVPEEMKQAILMLIAHYYEHRGDGFQGGIPLGVQDLLFSHKDWFPL